MTMTSLRYCLLSCLLVSAAAAQNLSFIPASFVDIGFGARPVALGGAFAGVQNDVNTMMWNPAGLASLAKKEATFSYTNQLGLIVYQSAGVAFPLDTNGRAIGIAAISSGDRALKELTIQATYAQTVTSELQLGVTAKYRNATFGNNSLNAADYFVFEPDEITDGMAQQIKGSANGFGFDAGVLYTPSRKISFGVTAHDFFAPVMWNSKTASSPLNAKGKYSESLPIEVVAGTSILPLENLMVNVDFSPAVSTTVSNKLRAGAELTLLKIVALRGGVQKYSNNDAGTSYAFGIGINAPVVKNYRAIVDYTYLHELLAATQRLSVGVEF